VLAAVPALAPSGAQTRTAALLYTALLAWGVLPDFVQAYHYPSPMRLRAAVRAGVLSLILLDAAIAAAYAGYLYAAGVVCLTFVARRLARLFAVT
jgi:hypothetical protein